VRLLLARHGETDWNSKGLIQGSQDTRLNELGREQARELGEHLHGKGVVRIYSSPLARARETAAIIKNAIQPGTKEDIPVILDPALQERGFGPLEGKMLKQLAPDELEFLRRLDTTIPGVEPLEAFRDRAFGFYKRLQQDVASVLGDDDAVLVVSHVGQLRVLFTDLLKVKLPEKPRNCAVFELRATPRDLAIVQLSEPMKEKNEDRKIILF
jgi:probable phosphoglycerate mutase